VKERELRGQLEKTTKRKVSDVRSEAREELNAAVVQTISESQSDLGVTANSTGAVNAEQLQSGAKIRVRGFSKPVIFRRLDGSSAEIEAGPLRMKVAVDEIIGIEGPPAGQKSIAPTTPQRNITVTSQSGEAPAAGEINVIGMRVEEATERVDKYLDEAALANRTSVRIIHGHGTGALRKGLAEFLRNHPQVESISFETEERGGKAITLVDLKS
jgi:DNA mismatch repair protein MutS2